MNRVESVLGRTSSDARQPATDRLNHYENANLRIDDRLILGESTERERPLRCGIGAFVGHDEIQRSDLIPQPQSPPESSEFRSASTSTPADRSPRIGVTRSCAWSNRGGSLAELSA